MERTARKEQPEQDGRTRQAKQDRQNFGIGRNGLEERTDRIGKAELDRHN
jgi:hypothetical protein